MDIFKDFLLLGNVWDVSSGLICQKLGFRVIGTSSAAVARSLGYEDGEDMPFDDLWRVVKAIRGHVDLPLSVDVEAGYGRSSLDIISNISRLIDLGVVGINIEDSVVERGVRGLIPADEFAQTLGDIKAATSGDLFINARTDAYILGLDKPLERSLERASLYKAAGADGLFVPYITDAMEIERLVDLSQLPLNVMCMPDLPDFEILQKLGVKRISMGPFAHTMMVDFLEAKLSAVIEDRSFKRFLGEI